MNTIGRVFRRAFPRWKARPVHQRKRVGVPTGAVLRVLRGVCLAVLLGFMVNQRVLAQPTAAPPDLLALDTADILDLSIEQLMGIPVTTVTGVELEWFQSPAAVYVVTPECDT